jgi:membrane-associated protease RseP (regulator of RpoE activity)
MKLHLRILLLPCVLGAAISLANPVAATAALDARHAKAYVVDQTEPGSGPETAALAKPQPEKGIRHVTVAVTTEDDPLNPDNAANEEKHKEIVIRTIEPSSGLELAGREVPWLGVSAEETSEALAAQLGLEDGAGLTVNFVAPESPAAKAGLKKNDVLVKFNDQLLVHPAQLRKLVRSRKEGDSVKLQYYRAGKPSTVSVTLGKTKGLFGMDGESGWEGGLRELKQQLGDLPIRPKIEEHMRTLRDSLGNLKIDQQKAQETLKKSLAEAQKELARALAQIPNANAQLYSTSKALKDLEQSRMLKDNTSSITIRSSGDSVKSLVKSDETGTIVIVSNPTPRLTAHDKDGKLVFDGEIQTEEQRDKVPRDLWERVEPLLDKMNSAKDKEE